MLGCADCHEDMLEVETHAGGEDLNAKHLEVVSCIACHDASEAEVGPHPDEAMGGVWTTVLSEVSRSGEPTVAAIVSHSVKWDVACDRCHFEDNPWELPLLEEAGGMPE